MSDDAAARIGRAFARVGWTGLCLQGVLIILPLLMLGYVIFGKVAGVREPLDFTEYLAFVGLLILAFTTFWSFYYTRVARQSRIPLDARRGIRSAKYYGSGCGQAASESSFRCCRYSLKSLGCSFYF